MVKYPGVVLFLVASSLSPSQLWTLKTMEAQPMYRLRVKMAAMGSVEDSVELKSEASLLVLGS